MNVHEFKSRYLRKRHNLTDKEATVLAEYTVRILQDQDLAQVAYLKLFQPLGTSYNPLRSENKLNKDSLDFPIAILCGANDKGGHGGCEEFVRINKYYSSGESQIFVVEDADETLL